MAFLVNTTGVVTLTDLGNRILSSGLSSFDLGAEFRIEELRYSADLASAIEAGDLEVVDDGRGRTIVGPVSAGIATAFVADIFHFEDADVTNVLGTSTLDSFLDVNLTSPIANGEALVYNSGSGEWENQAVAGGVASVNSQTGVVVLDADDISDAATTNKFVTASDITNLGNLSGTNSGDQTSIVGITGTKAQFNTAVTDGDFLYVGDAVTTVAAGSTNYLSITSGEISVSALAITSVDVFGTYTTTAAFIAAEYSGGTEFQEGDVVVLTAITAGVETYIHNGGVAGTIADFTLIQQPNLDSGTVRGYFTANAPIAYDNSTGIFGLDLKANGGLVVETNELALDLSASAITGTLAVADGGTGITTAPVGGKVFIGGDSGWTVGDLSSAGSTIAFAAGNGVLSLDVAAASLDETKLDVTNAPTDNYVLTYNAAGTNFTWIDPDTIVAAAKKTWSFGASSSASNTTDRFLDRHDGSATNQSPYVAWYACELRAISFATAVASTWTAEVYVNGASVATLTSGGAQFKAASGYSVSIAAGDRVAFYVNGTGVDKPSIDALFEEV